MMDADIYLKLGLQKGETLGLGLVCSGDGGTCYKDDMFYMSMMNYETRLPNKDKNRNIKVFCVCFRNGCNLDIMAGGEYLKKAHEYWSDKDTPDENWRTLGLHVLAGALKQKPYRLLELFSAIQKKGMEDGKNLAQYEIRQALGIEENRGGYYHPEM